jgi:hypothetical protein
MNFKSSFDGKLIKQTKLVSAVILKKCAMQVSLALLIHFFYLYHKICISK